MGLRYDLPHDIHLALLQDLHLYQALARLVLPASDLCEHLRRVVDVDRLFGLLC